MIMSSYYGSELIVPYMAKTIHNHCSKLNATTKDIDVKETLNNFCKVKEMTQDSSSNSRRMRKAGHKTCFGWMMRLGFVTPYDGEVSLGPLGNIAS